MLTRESIVSGVYLQCFNSVPAEIRWTQRKIDASMNEMMCTRPPGPLWIFGYGSLMWNPLLEFDEQQVATLRGWHRSFCLRTMAGRACVETPGRMLSLEAGGETRGLAFKLLEAKIANELPIVWVREMATGAYTPTWATIDLNDGSKATALVFVSNPAHAWHESSTDASEVAPLVAAAAGPLGTNAEYVHRLQEALLKFGLSDPYISDLTIELASISRAAK